MQAVWAYTYGSRQWGHMAPSSLPFQSPFGGLGLCLSQVSPPPHAWGTLTYNWNTHSKSVPVPCIQACPKHTAPSPVIYIILLFPTSPMCRDLEEVLLCVCCLLPKVTLRWGRKAREVLRTREGKLGIRSLNLVEACHQQGNNARIITNCLRPFSLPHCKPTIS